MLEQKDFPSLATSLQLPKKKGLPSSDVTPSDDVRNYGGSNNYNRGGGGGGIFDDFDNNRRSDHRRKDRGRSGYRRRGGGGGGGGGGYGRGGGGGSGNYGSGGGNYDRNDGDTFERRDRGYEGGRSGYSRGGGGFDGRSREHRGGGRRNRRKPEKNLSENPVRENGIIVSVREQHGYGFIRCAERDLNNLFFHFSDLADPDYEPKRADEVEFNHVQDLDSGRDNAGRVKLLESGTVTFEETLKEHAHGLVSRELVGGTLAPVQSFGRFARPPRDSSRHRKEAYGGQIQVIWPRHLDEEHESEDKDNEEEIESLYLEFTERDLESDVPLIIGDEVEFDIFREKRTGRKGACHIKFKKCAEVRRKSGIVSNVKDYYGWIVCEGSGGGNPGEDVWFHFNDVLSSKHTPQKGDEFEFTAEGTDGQVEAATRLCLLPKGTVKVDNISSETFSGVVTKELETEYRRQKRLPEKSSYHDGVIQLLEGDVQTASTFSFEGVDVDSSGKLIVGDHVQFDIRTCGKTGKQSAVHVYLVEKTKEGRECGIIIAVNLSYCFLDCEERTEQLFLHFSEMNPEYKNFEPRVKTEMEFNVSRDHQGKLYATRARVLPSGSVKFTKTLEGIRKGVVIKEVTKNPTKNMSYGRRPIRQLFLKGEIELRKTTDDGQDYNDCLDLLTFGEGDMAKYSPRVSATHLFLGDMVSCSVKVFKKSAYSLYNIKLLSMAENIREVGIVATVDDIVGRHTRSRRKDVEGSIRSFERPGSLIAFSTLNMLEKKANGEIELDVRNDYKPKVGDCLEFNVLKQGGRLIAVRIKRLPMHSVTVENVNKHSSRAIVLQIPSVRPAPRQGKKILKPGSLALLDEYKNKDKLESIGGEKYNLSSADIHPASLATSGLISYDAHVVHPGALKIPPPQVPFAQGNVTKGTYLRKGDLVECNVAVHVCDESVRRAINVVMLPTPAQVLQVNQSSKQGLLQRLPIGLPSIPGIIQGQVEEKLVFTMRDVLDGAQLKKGDEVILNEVTYDASSASSANKYRRATKIQKQPHKIESTPKIENLNVE